VHERTAQQKLIAEAQTTGLEARGRRQEVQSGSERINEGQGGQKETSQCAQLQCATTQHNEFSTSVQSRSCVFLVIQLTQGHVFSYSDTALSSNSMLKHHTALGISYILFVSHTH
jgi:hypothetical protein